MRMLTRHAEKVFGEEWPDPAREEIIPVDVTPVVKWLTSTGKSWTSVKELGAIRPPWPNSWVEYCPVADGIKRVGAHVLAAPPGQEFEFFLSEEMLYKIANIGDITMEEARAGDPVIVSWYFEFTGKRFAPLGQVYLLLDEGGHALTTKGCISPPDHMSQKEIDKLVNNFGSSLTGFLYPIWFGFALAHCTNVDIEEDEKPEAVRENRRKKGQNPGMTFKTLDIEPFAKEDRNGSGGSGSGVEKALHVCRGHFKEYDEENPLFGRHTGKFWVPQHMRGSKDAGEVDKDYRVNEPNS